MALLRWAGSLVLPTEVIVGAAQRGHYEFLIEYLFQPLPQFAYYESEYPMYHKAAGRGGRWDLILYLQRTFRHENSMNLVAAGALEADNIPLFLKAAPIIDVTRLGYHDSPGFESRNSWIIAAIESLPFPSESFAAFQRYFKTVYDRKVIKQFQDQGQLIKLKKALCSLVVGAAVAVGKLGVIDWIFSFLHLTNAEFAETYMSTACSGQEPGKDLLGPIFLVMDGRYGLLDWCRNHLPHLNRVLMTGWRFSGMGVIEYCLSKNVITGEFGSQLLVDIASESWSVMKMLQALPRFTLGKHVLDSILVTIRSRKRDFSLLREPDMLIEIVAWLKSLGATVNDFSFVNFFSDHRCLDTLKFISAAFGDDLFASDNSTIQDAFAASLNWISPDNLPGLLNFLHSRASG